MLTLMSPHILWGFRMLKRRKPCNSQTVEESQAELQARLLQTNQSLQSRMALQQELDTYQTMRQQRKQEKILRKIMGE